MNFQKLLLALSLSALTFGCGDATEKQIAPTSKTQAKEDQKDNPDTDYCELYGWYGDGECDDFCPEEDSDCSVTDCLAEPVCAPNELSVPDCDDPSYFNCREVTTCGTTIRCAEQTGCGSTDGAPGEDALIAVGCPDGYNIVDFCDASDDSGDCIASNECGNTTYCEREINCLEQLDCPVDTHYVETCPLGVECQVIAACDSYVNCAPSIQCDAEPGCDEGDTEVDEETDDRVYYQNHVCGETVTCSDTALPAHECNEQPSCPPGLTEVEECTSSSCVLTQTVCRERLLCQE